MLRSQHEVKEHHFHGLSNSKEFNWWYSTPRWVLAFAVAPFEVQWESVNVWLAWFPSGILPAKYKKLLLPALLVIPTQSREAKNIFSLSSKLMSGALAAHSMI